MASTKRYKLLPTSIYLTPLQRERLSALHESSRVPTSERVRQGIELVLTAHGVPMTVEGIQEYMARKSLQSP